MQQVKAVVIEIMGTTTPIEFFYKLVEDYSKI